MAQITKWFFILTFIQTFMFVLAELCRSGSLLLNLLVCLCGLFKNRFSSREEQMLVLLNSTEPKEAMSQDAVVTLFILF